MLNPGRDGRKARPEAAMAGDRGRCADGGLRGFPGHACGGLGPAVRLPEETDGPGLDGAIGRMRETVCWKEGPR